MSNRNSFAIVIGLAGLLGAGASFAQDPATDACGKREVSKKLGKSIGDAEKAFGNKQWDEVLAKIAEAEANPAEKTEFDKFWINEFAGRAYLNKQMNDEAAQRFERSVASPCIDAADKASRYKVLVQIAYQKKDYPKVIDVANRAVAETGDVDIASYLGNAYYATDDFPNARKVMTDVVAKQEAGSKPPEEITYRILQGSCIKLKDRECITEQLEKLVKHYPKTMYWQDLIAMLMAQTKNNGQLLNLWRLADATDAMSDPSEFTEMAQLAVGQGLPGEAQTIIEKGNQKGAFKNPADKKNADQLLADAKQAVALDKSTLDKQDAAARAKPTGESDVKLGAAYLSYADLPKAIEALQRGLGKGGVKNTDEANMLLGIAQLRSGNKPEAAKAFQAVTQDPMMTRIAKLWMLNT